jgi:hypothetical protein
MEVATEKAVERTPVNVHAGGSDGGSGPCFVEALIDPVSVFDHPREVVEHPLFTKEEKRMVLLSWARDELVAEQVTSRLAPELRIRSRIDVVVESLAAFDRGAAAQYATAVAAIRTHPVKRGRARRH